MSERFGDYAKDDSNIDLGDGEYSALITKAVIPFDPDTNGPLESFGKHVCDITFAIDGDEASTVKRRFSISFGKNSQTGQYAAFAQLIAAACGVPSGSRSQRDLGSADLEGKWVRAILQRQDSNGVTYPRVVNVFPPKHS